MLLLPTFNALLRPCPVSPAALTAHAQGHFCSSCQRVVHDFSQSHSPMADLAAARAASPDGRVCGSFWRAQAVAPAAGLTRRLRWFLLALVLIVGQGLSAREALAQVRKPVSKHDAYLENIQISTALRTEETTMLSGDITLLPAKNTVPVRTGNEVYTYVEQMPQPPGGGGNAAIMALIQKGVRIPLVHGQFPERSRVMFEFTVNPAGYVRDIRILQGIGSQVDTAVVRAVRALPRFAPGRQQGVPVSVKYTLPISFHWQ